MNNLRNSVRLIGNLGMDPEIREITNDRKMAKFSLATTESYTDKLGGKVTDTQWHNMVCWGKQANLAAQYLHKGSKVIIEGKLISRSYVDKEGVKRFITEIVVNEIMFLNDKNKAA